MDQKQRILILGGTGEAVALVRAIEHWPSIEVITSLAGRTRSPLPIEGRSRRGGFGGVAGLVAYLRAEAIDLVIDATHPFAAQMSHQAAQAAADCGLPHLILARPPWQAEPGDRWFSVPSHEAAAAQLDRLGRRCFLTIGRQELAAYAQAQDHWFLMRMIDPPEPGAVVPPGRVILDRGPFSLADERSLLTTEAIDVVVSKNSGGPATYAKIAAARELGLPVVMVDRPALPPADQVADLAAALAWLAQRVPAPDPEVWPVQDDPMGQPGLIVEPQSPGE